MKYTGRILSALLVICLILSLSAFASGEASGGSAEPAVAAYTITPEGLADNSAPGVTVNSGMITDTYAYGLDMSITEFGTGGFQVTDGGTFYIVDSNITKSVSGPVDVNAAGGVIAGVNNGLLYINNSTLTNAGKGGRSGNYTVECARGGVMVVANSNIIQTGLAGDPNGYTAGIADPPSNLALLILGYARANMSVGTSKTYYYGSHVETEGWAAMSTDSAQSGFAFYSYDSEAVADHGGYGTYADTSCVDWFYASGLRSAEVGAIISNNGEIHMRSGAAADETVLAYLPQDYTVTERYGDGRCTVTAGRNDFQLHSPDMGGGGARGDFVAVLDLEDTDLVTSTELDSQATLTDWSADYGPAVAQYVGYIKGANILVKSTGADIDLKNVTAESYSGVLLQTALNSDSMSRYALAADDMSGRYVNLTITDSAISGDVNHFDYQRNTYVELVNSTWDGAYVTIDKAAWDAAWSEEAKADPYCCWILDTSKYFDGTGILSILTVDAGSTWNVTGTSNLDVLYVAPGGTVNGNVTVDGVEADLSAGGYWAGDIVVYPIGTDSWTAPIAAPTADDVLPADAGENGEPVGFDPSMNEGLDASAYPHFDEYRDYVAALILADAFMSGTNAYADAYAAASPYIAPFVDVNPVIGAMDYDVWMNTYYPGEAFPAA